MSGPNSCKICGDNNETNEKRAQLSMNFVLPSLLLANLAKSFPRKKRRILMLVL